MDDLSNIILEVFNETYDYYYRITDGFNSGLVHSESLKSIRKCIKELEEFNKKD